MANNKPDNGEEKNRAAEENQVPDPSLGVGAPNFSAAQEKLNQLKTELEQVREDASRESRSLENELDRTEKIISDSDDKPLLQERSIREARRIRAQLSSVNSESVRRCSVIEKEISKTLTDILTQAVESESALTIKTQQDARPEAQVPKHEAQVLNHTEKPTIIRKLYELAFGKRNQNTSENIEKTNYYRGFMAAVRGLLSGRNEAGKDKRQVDQQCGNLYFKWFPNSINQFFKNMGKTSTTRQNTENTGVEMSSLPTTVKNTVSHSSSAAKTIPNPVNRSEERSGPSR